MNLHRDIIQRDLVQENILMHFPGLLQKQTPSVYERTVITKQIDSGDLVLKESRIFISRWVSVESDRLFLCTTESLWSVHTQIVILSLEVGGICIYWS